MFKDHNPIINEYMQANHQQMCDGIMFVVLSVKMPFQTMGKQMRDYREKGGDSQYIWGFKRQTHEYLQEHGADLYDELMDLSRRSWHSGKGSHLKDRGERDKRMMLVLTDVPGLGLAKAGFVMQMMFGRVGCIDVHNLKRLRSVSEKDLSFQSHSGDKTKIKKIEKYVQICKHNNSTQRLWDQWCNQLTHKQCNRSAFSSGDDVSAFHVTALIGA